MKNWKTTRIILFVLVCILLNYGGRILAGTLNLPLWLDSLGTVTAAVAGGPLVGIIIGVTANCIYSSIRDISYIFGINSALLALIVGTVARRGWLRTSHGTAAVSLITALVSVAISVPLSYIYFGGTIGNAWGDGVMNFLIEQGFSKPISIVAGQFCLDFMDRLITLFLLHGLMKLRKKPWETKHVREEGTEAGSPSSEGASSSPAGSHGSGAALGLLLLLAAGSLSLNVQAGTEDEASSDYVDYIQTIYDGRNGLACGEANDIAETNDGILWVGTYAGLYRYNGREFRWMNEYESVRNVNCLYVDAEGRLWIGTNDNGLSISINERIVNVLDQERGLPSNTVRSIVQSSDGYYYIGTAGSLQILTLSSGLKRVASLQEIDGVESLCADENGQVAAVTSDGRLFLLRKNRVLSSLMLVSEQERFKSCCFGKNGLLMAGTSLNNIYVYDTSADRFTLRSILACHGLSSINDLHLLDNDEIFICSDSGIGYLTEEQRFHFINVKDFGASIDNMLMDYQGNLWFCSSRLGLLRLSESPFRDVYTTTGLGTKVVNAITSWQGTYYFGTDKGLDAADSTCRNPIANDITRSLADIRIRCVLTDSAGSLWICTYGEGLLEYTPDGTRYVYGPEAEEEANRFSSRARLVTELSDGSIAVSGDAGIAVIRDHRIRSLITKGDGLPSSSVLCLLERPDGSLLAGTDGDGIAVIRDGSVTELLDREAGLTSEIILRMTPDVENGTVFVITSNSLCIMDSSLHAVPCTHFPYFNNYDLWIKDASTVYVTGSSGIYVVSRADLLADTEDMDYDLLDASRGLNSALTANSWNYTDQKGNLFLAGDRGVFVIDTNRYAKTTPAYRLTISSVSLDNQPVRLERGTPITVSRSVSRIELLPEIINFTVEDPYVGYYLEGFDSDWTIVPQSSLNSIAYTNLPTGRFTFHIAVFDHTKQQILEERTYLLTKDQAIYDNLWFRMYMLLVAMLTVSCVTWVILQQQTQRMLHVQERELEVARKQIQMGNETIIAIAKAVDAKDERTSQHSYRVSEYSFLIGRELGLDEKECLNLRNAARMHDIGKIGIPDSILNKPARLTDEEYAVMKSHTTKGGEILKDFTLIDNVIDGAIYHHERYDGKGYPSGLAGEEIPLYGRIIGVADAFDAMTANRVYRKQMDFDYVLGELKKGKGSQFDPLMVDIMLGLIDSGKIDLTELYPELKEAAARKTADEGGQADAGQGEKTDDDQGRKTDADQGGQADAKGEQPAGEAGGRKEVKP